MSPPRPPTMGGRLSSVKSVTEHKENNFFCVCFSGNLCIFDAYA